MYYKIKKYGHSDYLKLGMINVEADFFLEENDEGYKKYISEHYVQVPVLNGAIYDGKKNDAGFPFDSEDYKKWIDSFPKVYQLNPFCNHAIQFEHNVTVEEIKKAFDRALGITHQNYLIDDLHCLKGGQVVNENINYGQRILLFKNPTPVLQAKIISAEQNVDLLDFN
jgi:hypothetical protein